MTLNWLSSVPHARWLESETDHLLDFARAARHPSGGFAWLDAAGQPDAQRPVELWVTCRMTHVFSLGALLGRPGCAPLADHGIAALRGPLADSDHGGWWSSIAPGQGPTVRTKDAYGHAFVVIAAASATVAERPGAADLLSDALTVLLGRFWDDEHGMVVEEWDESFSHLDPYRGVNANMHTVEALLAAADVTGDRTLLDRALRITTRVVHELGRGHSWRLPEHFDESWTPILDYNIDSPAHPFRPYGATVGHALEWSRLVLHLRAALGDKSPTWLLPAARDLFDRAVQDGWAADGTDGFVYTTDWDGHPLVRERMHWVPAEATATAAALHSVTRDDRYADWYARTWDHIMSAFRDRAHGSWHHELTADHWPSSTVWSGKPDIYHALQATLLPRLPLAPSLATALKGGLLG